VVPRESAVTPDQQLTPGERLVLHTVTHTWHIDELGFIIGGRNSDTTSAGWISRRQTQTRRTRLGRSVTFDDGTRENDTQEFEHLGIQRGRTRGDEAEFSTKQLSNLGYHTLELAVDDRGVSYLLEYKTVPKRMSIDPGCFESFKLGVDCPPEQGPLETRGVCGGHDVLVYFVQ
jgi:hypothetical protein